MTSLINEVHRDLDTLWYTRCGIPTPLGIAAQLGWYQREFSGLGIGVRSLQESNDPQQLASHFEHTLPHSFRLGGSIPPIWARSAGTDTKVIGISWIDEYQVILSLPGSGIREPKDLKGRKLGLPKKANNTTIDVARASALKAFITTLELAGLSHQDVEFVDVLTGQEALEQQVKAPDTAVRRRRVHSYTSVAHALIKGEVDAIYVKDVRGAETAHLLDAHVVIELGFHPDPQVRINNCTPRPLTVNGATVRDYPELVDQFLRTVVDVGFWAEQHPQETIREIATETGWAEHWVRFAYGPYVHKNLHTNLEPSSLKALESYKNFLLQWGFLKGDFDFNAWIDPQPYSRVLQNYIRKTA